MILDSKSKEIKHHSDNMDKMAELSFKIGVEWLNQYLERSSDFHRELKIDDLYQSCGVERPRAKIKGQKVQWFRYKTFEDHKDE